MVFLTVTIALMAIVVFGGLVAFCVFACLSLVAGFILRESKVQAWAPFFIWIPSSMATFAVVFTIYSFYALTHSWGFPADLLQYIVALGIGEALAIAAGSAIALRRRESHGFKNIKSS
jgi:hypothetical protein